MAKKRIVLSLRNISMDYGSRRILDGINLELYEGDFVAIVGKSGCGKTTLLNTIAGFLKFKGKMKKPSRVGMVFQDYSVFPWLTVKENIAFSLKKNSIAHYLKMAQLWDKRNEYPPLLSGGQIQRVAIARALATDPELLLMDEPYGSLDVFTREKMQHWLLEVWDTEKKTVLFVTHSVDEALILADRIVVMKKGKICCNFENTLKRPRSEKIRFEKDFLKLKKEIYESI